ncbi:SEFIR domain-containing protein [Nocardia niwae]|uniref:SEFIR domain-containing protein n=1 Tax=Nocardia niwae TaxID=626084 RepID=A0ABV2XE85_9NOCA
MSTDDQAVDTAPGGDPVAPRVFVSYSHDSDEHKESVRRFCTFLRETAGVDAHLDVWYDDGRRDWSLWAIDQLTEADFILIIASPEYKRRADGAAPADEGRGAQFEAAIIRDNLTRNLRKETRRVLPVVLPGRSVDEIPTFLAAHSTTRYEVEEFTLDGIADLLIAFTGIPKYPMPTRARFVGSPFASRTQAPSASAATSSPQAPGVSTATSSAPRKRLLTAALQPVTRGPDLYFGSADLNGEHYGDSILHRCSMFCGDPRSAIEYNLGRDFRFFEATVGVLDDAEDAGQIGYFQVFLDNEPQKLVRATHGDPGQIRYEVTGVLRLRLVAYRPDTVASPMLAGAMLVGGRRAKLPALAWGDPTLVR